MAQADLNIVNQSGAAFRADLNNQLLALGTLQSGNSAPSTTYQGMFWLDTSTSPSTLRQRNDSNNGWVVIGTLTTNLGLLSLSGGTLVGAVLFDDSGTAALPALAFDGDPDTGFYRKAANQVGVSTAGVERLFVDSNGVTILSQGDLRLGDSDNSNWVALRSPSAVPANVRWTLPAADGSNGQAIVTDGSGNLSFANFSISYATTSEVSGVFTTGSVTSGTTSLVVASATGIASGMYVVGEGITPGTTVSGIAGTTVTLSANANATLSGDAVSFFIANKALSPGLVAGQLCRAWVNFNGTDTVSIRASYNVSSITDNGTGDYTVNFTTAMPDANYSVQLSHQRGDGAGVNPGAVAIYGQAANGYSPLAGSVRVISSNTSATAIDVPVYLVSIFR